MHGLIDVHHHIVPKEYVKSLSDKGFKKALGVRFPNWNANKALEVMDRNGISTSMISISAPGVYFKALENQGFSGHQKIEDFLSDKDPSMKLARELSRQTNETCAGLIEDHPGRFGAFATLPLPDVGGALEELKYALDVLKLDGVFLLSNYDGYYLGDPRFDRLFSELNRRKVAVFIHPASPPGFEKMHLGFPESMADVCFDTTRTVLSLMVKGVTKKYPDIRFILAHAGGTVPYIAARIDTLFSLFASLGGVSSYVAEGVDLVSHVVPKLKESFPEELKIYLNVKDNVLPEGPDFYLKRFYYDAALSASPHAFASLQTLVDSSKIVFGSDYIFATEAAVPVTIKGIREYAGFNEKDLAAIERENAMDLFPRLKKI